MVRIALSLVFGWLILCFPAPGFAHFGMIIPSASMVDRQSRNLGLTMSFSHPFAQEGMELVKPLHAGVFLEGTMTDLAKDLRKTTVFGHTAWSVNYRVKRPGVYTFVMEPHPYWEPAEDCFIIHYTKTIVGAFGEEEGWERPAGLKTEIVPLTRPFGLYAGNVFQGQILLDGKPAPHTPVEIEYYNPHGPMQAPHPYLATQVVRADANGVFTVGIPAAGWWGFAGLNTADYQIRQKGTPKDVELGAVLWVEVVPWPEP
ncbi:DUF4198 domain-containing protein [Desulfoplanes formicivorans]|uniref:ATP-dependent DNA ligase n=1 Tax=Desulfoplanes formicivorans TaxID=1592317 RepID=A0A194AI12_9BACT|nr:DUF4198 domain-containing protein [Desulfoplanes formicivorans]GAU08865.1 ATP-dependent DNA ligase [Desulfoplanes formicivorans]